MKYLSDIIGDRQSECFEKHGAFFAFSQDQFKEKANPALKYANLGAGLVAPINNANALAEELDTIATEGIKEDIALHGINNIIVRELNNHEAYYTGDISSTVDALQDYPGFDAELINNVFRNKNYDPDNQ
jgi:hypothetical protein